MNAKKEPATTAAFRLLWLLVTLVGWGTFRAPSPSHLDTLRPSRPNEPIELRWGRWDMVRAFSGKLAILALVCVIIAACGGRSATVLDTRSPVQIAVGQVKPSLVRIAIVEPAYYGGREQNFVATGSGTIITPEGHIVTNHHVAGKAVRIMCTMPNREEIPARLVGTDPATDIAVIQLMPPTPRTFPYVEFGDSDALRAGDTVLALGSPLGLSQSVTMGIVSNPEMVMPSIFRIGMLELDGENVGELVRWIGHDAMIHGGNSGGPII